MKQYDHKKIEKKWPDSALTSAKALASKKSTSGKQVEYNHKKIEKKWQKKWLEDNLYHTSDFSSKPKCFVLDMFPYPSGEGLHVGHPKGYIATDVYSRMKTMQGFNVLHPMGFDAFGLPAENYALKNKIHPSLAVAKNIARYKKQLEMIGFNYDWAREINTTDPEYYKWTQWIFLQMFKKGLAYESFAPINWCPSCQTGLANEDLEDGRCERCDSEIEKRPMRQWVLKITDYADRLLTDLDLLDWPKHIKESQKNWIGRSEATEIDFKIESSDKIIKIVTTRPDTIFGATFIVIAPEHALIDELSSQIENLDEVMSYRQNSSTVDEFERGKVKRNKTGIILKGVQVTHPFTGANLPVFTSDFIIPGYGTGAIMGVPGHDDRDFDFATKFSLPINIVLERPHSEDDYYYYLYNEDNSEVTSELRELGTKREYMTPTVVTYIAKKNNLDKLIKILQKYQIGTADDLLKIKNGQYFTLEPGNKFAFTQVYSGDGVHINSDFLNGLKTDEAINLIHQRLLQMKIGKAAVHYRLKDWVFSRQRYWGEPIPIIHCVKCGVVPVPEKDLPVKLPEVEHYEPTGTGESPLANITDWVNTICPTCGGEAKRETNTMPQWAGSSWYYLRFMDPKNKETLVDPDKEKYWMGADSSLRSSKKSVGGVDVYVGGTEHATRHLIYARFWHKFLYDIGVVSTLEPFARIGKSLGLILGEDGKKMSKRFGNVVNPDEVVALYGADTLRVYEMFMGPFEGEIAWSTDSMIGSRRFLEKVWRLQSKIDTNNQTDNVEILVLLHQTIKKVGEDIESFSFNTAVSSLMILVNKLETLDKVNVEIYQILLKLLSPFAPHMAEEIWQNNNLGPESITLGSWPSFDGDKLSSDEITVIIQINGKMREKIIVVKDLSDSELLSKVKILPKIQKALEGRVMDKEIVVKNRLVNFVVV